MGAEDILINQSILNDSNSTLIGYLPPEIISRIESLITILKITGFIIIGYIIFLFVKWFLAWKRNREINKIYKKVYDIDRKIDVLLRKKDKKNK